MLAARRHPGAEAAHRRLPAPAVGRHAPARHDRDGAHQLAGAPDRRRADDGPRRHRPGPDPRADRAASRREFNTTVILITHDLGIVADVADEVAVMYGGRIVELAPTSTLYDQPGDALHARAPLVDPADGPRAAGAARPDPGQPAVADPAPEGLRLPAALQLHGARAGRGVPDRSARAPASPSRTTSSAATCQAEERKQIARRRRQQDPGRRRRPVTDRRTASEILDVTDLRNYFPVKLASGSSPATVGAGEGGRRHQPDPQRRRDARARGRERLGKTTAGADDPDAGPPDRRQDQDRRPGHHEALRERSCCRFGARRRSSSRTRTTP